MGAGLRQGETFGLDADKDIDEVAGVIHVRRQVKRVAGKLVFGPPKGGKERTTPLPVYLAAQIRAHRAAFPPQRVTLPWQDPRPPTRKRETEERAPRTHNLLVTSAGGGAVRAWSWNQHYWKKALAAAGCRESVVSVSKWLGHADPAITPRVYAHFMPEADGRGRAAMDAWFEDATEADSQKISPDSPQAPSRGGVSALPDGPAASDQTKSAAPSENEKDLVGVGS